MLKYMCDERDQHSIIETVELTGFLMWWPYSVSADFAGWMLHWTHPHPGGRWAVPFGHRVHRCGAGYQASLRHPVGLEDLGQV